MLGLFWLYRNDGEDMPSLAHGFMEQFELYVALVYVLEDMPTFEKMMSQSSAL